MDNNWVLIVASGLVVVSYLFNVVSRLSQIPAVLLLLAVGIGLRYATDRYGLAVPALGRILPTLGTVGLILIVLEGALELELGHGKLGLVGRAAGAATVLLLLTALSMATILAIAYGDFHQGLLNAIPLAVISSAIAIPSAAYIADASKREFITYESTFSDILGIMMFNFVLNNPRFSPGLLPEFGIEFVLVLLIALLSCFLLVYVMSKTTHHVKFFLIIALLVLVYSVGKLYHLSPLLIVLVFGLMITNTELVIPKFLRKHLVGDQLDHEIPSFISITAESAFVIRTFFFVVFGYTIDLALLGQFQVVLIGTLLTVTVFVVRAAYLKWVLDLPPLPLLFIAPRGLVTVLIYFGIPSYLVLPGFDGVLLFVIIATNIIMAVGLIVYQRRHPAMA